MKNFLFAVSIFLLSINAYCESLKMIQMQKSFQDNISQEILKLKRINPQVTSLEKYIHNYQLSCQQKFKNAADQELKDFLLETCQKEIQMMHAFNDLETILDYQITQLEEAQTSVNLVFAATRSSLERLEATAGSGQGTAGTFGNLLLVISMPVIFAFELLIMPISLSLSALTGF